MERLIQDPFKHLRKSFFAKILQGFQLLTIFAKSSNLDVWQGSEYVTALYNEFLGDRKIVYVS